MTKGHVLLGQGGLDTWPVDFFWVVFDVSCAVFFWYGGTVVYDKVSCL